MDDVFAPVRNNLTDEEYLAEQTDKDLADLHRRLEESLANLTAFKTAVVAERTRRATKGASDG